MGNYPIPPIMDDIGAAVAREQPKPEELVFIGTEHVAMSEASIAKLPEYSGTLPTGVYPGKMWLCRIDDGRQTRHDIPREDREWLLCWYGIHPTDPNLCTIEHRKVLKKEVVDLLIPKTDV